MHEARNALAAIRPCLAVLALLLAGCDGGGMGAPIVDEAKALGKTPDDFPASDYDYFAGMDKIAAEDEIVSDGATGLRDLALTPDEIKGRNTWMMWCGGNEVFWDWLAGHSYGFMDLLKLCDFSPDDSRGGQRFGPAGLTIEPETIVPEAPDEFGLYIRRPAAPDAPRPRAEIYGYSSGIVGLRLFPNPKFDEKARAGWDAERYRKDADYYNDPDLVRPYRVGMSCAFCHASPHPLNPPADVEAPEWSNLSSNIGAQYFRTRAVFGNLLAADNFVYHLLDSQPPGTIDTSLVASDNVNNPNTMNAIWDVPARLDRSGIFVHRSPEYAAEYRARYGHNVPEDVSGDSARMPVLLENVPGALDDPRPVPRVLLDGADAVGAWGALARVYLNIGTFSERWITLHNPLVGLREQEPFEIADCEANSVYWSANKRRVEYLAKFFLKSTAPMRLKDAPGGREEVAGAGVPWTPELAAGRKVFAENCIVCHSSKQPNGRDGAPQGPQDVPDSGLLALLRDPGYRAWALAEVDKPDFWRDNLLSTDRRVGVDVLETNASRAMASNAVAGHMWEDFSSDTYKALPGVGALGYWNPYTDREETWTPPAGGRGYYRPASLISIWATAPFLHNNSVGLFNNDPSVKGRLAAFDDAIRRLLPVGRSDAGSPPAAAAELARKRWEMGPAADVKGTINGADAERFAADHGLIWRTSGETNLHIPARNVQGLLAGVVTGRLTWLVKHPWITPVALLLVALAILLKSGSRTLWRLAGYAVALVGVAAKLGDLDVGPIPAGTPVSLLANVNAEDARMPANLRDVIKGLRRVKKAESEEARRAELDAVGAKLLEISSSPDLVMDRGHYFSGALTEREREDLIDLLKTF
jgi:hypothetical protein